VEGKGYGNGGNVIIEKKGTISVFQYPRYPLIAWMNFGMK
jgi:hypothetical protein